MSPALSRKDVAQFLGLVVLSSCFALEGCGSDQHREGGIFDEYTHPNMHYQAAVTKSIYSYDDCYDVALEENYSGGTTAVDICSSFRIAPGIFITAAHCVISTRPQTSPPPSVWTTDQRSFTFNPSYNGRNDIQQIKSIQILVPPDVSNYTNAQYQAGLTQNMIATDIAVVITNDTQAAWDKFPGIIFDTPSTGNTGYIAGYGYSMEDQNGNFSDLGRRRYGAITVSSVGANGVISFYGGQGVYGVKGDSGGPIYAANAGQDNRRIIGMMAGLYKIPSAGPSGSNTYSGYNYSPNLGGGPTAQWLGNTIQRATQVVNCLANAYNNARSQCLI